MITIAGNCGQLRTSTLSPTWEPMFRHSRKVWESHMWRLVEGWRVGPFHFCPHVQLWDVHLQDKVIFCGWAKISLRSVVMLCFDRMSHSAHKIVNASWSAPCTPIKQVLFFSQRNLTPLHWQSCVLYAYSWTFIGDVGVITTLQNYMISKYFSGIQIIVTIFCCWGVILKSFERSLQALLFILDLEGKKRVVILPLSLSLLSLSKHL